VAEQRTALERRAHLLLAAQREYFNTMTRTDAYWSAASGYRIGAMYESFWDAIMTAPTPPPRSEMTAEERAIYEEEYRSSLALLVKPLIRHSIRYWELTLMMVERTGVRSEWTARMRGDVERMRGRLMDQPTGPEGINGAPPPPDPPAAPAPEPLEPADGLPAPSPLP
jgi:hypothetical protein